MLNKSLRYELTLSTGDPKIPPEVKRAKLLYKEIENKSESKLFDDDEPSEKDEDELTSEKGEKESESPGGDEVFTEDGVQEGHDDEEGTLTNSSEETSTAREGSVPVNKGKKRAEGKNL